MSCAFQRYLIGSTVAGGLVGLTHGLYAIPFTAPQRNILIAQNTLSGALLGPWAPVAVPVYATRWWPRNGDCPWMRRAVTPRPEGEHPTVAEKP